MQYCQNAIAFFIVGSLANLDCTSPSGTRAGEHSTVRREIQADENDLDL